MSVFDTTPPLSSYLYGFCVGEFSEIKFNGPYTDRLLNVPSSIYFREPIREFTENSAKLIFEANLMSLKIYQEHFKVKFPFKKHDLIFCRDFTVGAMEYPGCVTYNDSLIIRDQNPSQQQIM